MHSAGAIQPCASMSFHGASYRFGPIRREHVALAAVLADQRGGQPEPAPRLQVGRHPEHRRGQQVHLVVDDQPPVAAVEQLEVTILTLGAAGDHLIRRDRDGPDLLAFAGVLADLLLGQRGAGDQLTLPLPARDRVGDQDQGGGTRLGHRRRADERLAGTARQHDHAGAARPERVGGHLLIVAQLPTVLLERDGVRLAVDVARQVLGGPPDLEQHLLDPATLAGVHEDGVVIDAGAEHRGYLLVAQHFFEHRTIQADQHQPVHGAFHQLQPAVAGHRVDDVDEQRLRHRVARERHQRIDHLLGVVTRRAGVPQGKRGDAVGVNVLGCALQFGERSDRRAGGASELVVDFEQHGLVGLHDQGAIGHARCPPDDDVLLALRVIPTIIPGRPTPPTSRGESRTRAPARTPDRRRSADRP